MKYRLAIFDMDGTILDTLTDLTNCINTVLTRHSYPIRTTVEVRKFLGNGLRKLVESAVPDNITDDQLNSVYDDMLKYYPEHSKIFTKPYDGIVELLGKLRIQGLRTAVISNKLDVAVHKLCKEFFDGLFDVEIGDRPGFRRKPFPDSVNTVLEKLQINKCDAVYIGDSEVDLMTAKNAGIDCIAVDWGFRDRQELINCGAKTVVSNTGELYSEIIS